MRSDPGRPDLIFFDVGDTLMRIHPSWTAVYLEVCREYGLDVEDEALGSAFAQAYDEGLWDVDGPFETSPEASFQRIKAFDVRAMELLGRSDLPEAFYRLLHRRFDQGAVWHVFPDVHPALETLTSLGIRRAVISNWVWVLPELLHDLDIAHHFEAIVASARVGYQKPQPEIFQHALDLTGVRPERAIHVGDNPVADVAGARSVGIRPVLIDRAGRYPDGLPGQPDVPVVRDFSGVLAILDVPVLER